MNRKIFLSFMLTSIVLFTMSACARVHVAAPELDAQAKAMTAPKDKALVYFYRNESIGGGVRMKVKIDGREMGVTGPKSYMMFLLAPGKHLFTSEAENTSEIDLDAKAGETYYIWQEVKMGVFYAGSKLMLMHNAEGKKGLMECDLVEHSQL